MSYMILSSQGKALYFRKELLYDTFFYSVRTFARIRQHCFSKYWSDGCMGRPPTSNFWEDRPPSSPRSPPLSIVSLHLIWRGLYLGLKRPRIDYTRVYSGLGQFIPRSILWPEGV